MQLHINRETYPEDIFRYLHNFTHVGKQTDGDVGKVTQVSRGMSY